MKLSFILNSLIIIVYAIAMLTVQMKIVDVKVRKYSNLMLALLMLLGTSSYQLHSAEIKNSLIEKNNLLDASYAQTKKEIANFDSLYQIKERIYKECVACQDVAMAEANYCLTLKRIIIEGKQPALMAKEQSQLAFLMQKNDALKQTHSK